MILYLIVNQVTRVPLARPRAWTERHMCHQRRVP